jgi:hypothetical protein
MTPKTDKVEIKTGCSNAEDETVAVEQFAEQLKQPALSFVMFFVSSLYDLPRINDELKKHFDCPLFGCTTSGEITPEGYLQHSITGFSAGGEGFIAHPFLIESLHEAQTNDTAQVFKELKESQQEIREAKPERNIFGMLLIDGLSVMEEKIIAILSDAAGDMPIVGGSAGDDIKLEQTHVYSNGKFYTDAALFIMCETVLPFVPIKTQHFTASDNRLVITKATPENRIVQEINGLPAAQEYARIVGVEAADINPDVFSTYPVMLKLGGKYYVRSIQKVNEDGSLRFFCAIDEGLVLRVASGENLVENLDEALNEVREELPEIKLTIGFDCILRLLEVKQKNLEKEVNEIFKKNRVIGFNTYGEQFNSVHVNQTFTGIVLGDKS